MSVPLPRRGLSVLAATAALGLLGTAPAAAHPHRIDYVNLGDSYSAAIGTGTVTGPPPGSGCPQGEGPDHVSALDARRRVELLVNAACPGATTDQVQTIASSEPVAAALREAELVTLTLGGNDVGWTDYLRACSVQGGTTAPAGACDGLISQAQARIDAAAVSAGETVRALDEATCGTVVVLGYPHLFEGNEDTAYFSAARATQLNALTDELNAALAGAVTDGTDDVIFVDVAERFAGHGVDAADPWIHFDPAAPEDPDNFHPNEAGYLGGYYSAFKSSVGLRHLGR